MSDTGATSARNAVVAAALDLFHTQGFDATSVDQIAQAAGISRSTFFRQFGSKDDVIFADHAILLERLREQLAVTTASPWLAVRDASLEVYRHFADDPELARRRYRVVRHVPVLRDREIVTVFQYERLFDEHLRGALPGLDPMDAVAFAASVTAVHNHVLRRLLRGSNVVPASVLTAGLDEVLRRFGVSAESTEAADDDVIVVAFPRRMPHAEVARRLSTEL